MNKEMKESKLKVMEALQEEAYKGIVRIDSETMKQIGVHPGDIVEIEGSRLTVGVVDRAYPSDVGQSIIRMDGILRRNAQSLFNIGLNNKPFMFLDGRVHFNFTTKKPPLGGYFY